MFSSCTNNSPDLLPQISPPPSDLFLLHHHDSLFSTHFDLPEIDPHVLQAAIDLPVQSNTALGCQDLGTSVTNSFPRRKRAVKNDRHSKIFTSTGPRDRRVRLSLSIARRFFDLQDRLGFSKPSKTLDWLLTKSKTAIKELIRTKQCHNKVFSSPSDDQCKNINKSNEKSVEEVKDPVRVRDSRARARARARERTREKMCIKRVLNVRPIVDPVLDFNGSVNQSQARPSSSSSILGTYQQSLRALSDLSTANAENWDISSIIRSQSRSSAIFDQLN